jgi:hypothetical protein
LLAHVRNCAILELTDDQQVQRILERPFLRLADAHLSLTAMPDNIILVKQTSESSTQSGGNSHTSIDRPRDPRLTRYRTLTSTSIPTNQSSENVAPASVTDEPLQE